MLIQETTSLISVTFLGFLTGVLIEEVIVLVGLGGE